MFFFSQGLDVTLEFQETLGLIALQGPDSAKALQELTPKVDLSKLTFMTSGLTSVAGIENCRVTRCGYVTSKKRSLFAEKYEGQTSISNAQLVPSL